MSPTDRMTDRLAGLSPEQRALFEKLREKQRKAAARPPQPPPLRRVTGPTGAGAWPLSLDQERLWFLSLLDPESTAYNMVSAIRLGGILDVPSLAGALREIARRHGAWRTSFPRVDGLPVQRVSPEPSLPLPLVDLAALPGARRRAAALELAEDDARRPFSMERGPLVRATLVRLAEREHLCILSVHHIVSDFVSFQLVWHEVGVLYEALSRGRPSPLPELPVQFADFAVWQREWMSGEVLRNHLEWWQEQLRGFPLFLELPADRPRSVAGTQRGGRHHVVLSPGLVRGVRELARREGVTRFMAVTAICAALLHRLSGQERLVPGTLNANRNRPELAPLLGFFLTQLPLPLDLAGDPTFRELLGRVRQVALGAFAHQDLPFGKLVEILQPERDLSRMPLVQVLVQLIDAQGTVPGPGSLELEAVDVDDGNARYELMLTLYELSDGIQGSLEYNAEIFDASTTRRWLELFFRLTEAAVADPGRRLSALPTFGEAERHQVLVEWNDTALAPPSATVVRQFQEQAARTPDAVAWTGDGWSLTYAELEDRSNRLARHLRRLGAGPEVLVGLFLERDALLPVGLLGILKAGAVYLPLDLAHPAERRALVLVDAAAPLIVTCERLLAELPDTAARKVCLDAGWSAVAAESGEPPPLAAGPENLAYVIYTSGSTGRPKGVEITHGALAGLLAALRQLYRVGPGDAMPGITTPAFDLSVPELYLPMLGGGTTPLLSRETAADGVLLARALDAAGATVLQAAPATYRQLLESGWEGRPEMLLLCGAEALDRELADRLLPLGRGLWNFYGPTEATVWATAWNVEPEGPVSIGRPLAGYQVHLLGPGFLPVPLGAEGEICIGGAGLARGYFGRPELTAERFIPHPGEAGARLYRTGDLGRFLPGGLLQYAGRADHQVKLRGFRIELGEIEAALRCHPAVSEGVVLRREDRPGDARLVAFLGLVPGSEAPRAGELRSLLQGVLPDYMVPSVFVPLPALPRNANGKVDRKALAAIRAEPAAPVSGRVAPRTPVEELLAAIWSQVLEVREVGARDDFFALGGHSLLATRIVTRIREAFGVELPVRSVFQAPTLAAQAELVAAARAARADDSPRSEPIRPVPRGVDLPLSFAQERLWFLQQLDPDSAAWNIPLALRVTGDLDVPALERVFTEVASRHETLRATFHDRGGIPVQRIAPPAAWTIPVTDLAAVADPAGEVARLAEEDALAPFDLARGPLLRTRLLRLAPHEHVLLLCIHHAVADLWGLGILIQEVAALYEGGGPLPELPVQYPDFAAWQRGWLRGEELERQVAFWRAELAGAPAALDLPTDRPRPSRLSPRGASLPAALGPALSESVARLGRERGATPFMVLIAALGAVCARWAGQEDVVLGAPIANRQRPELEGLVGMFVNSLPLRVRTGGEPSFADLLARARRTALDAYEHQDVPFEKLVEELRPPRHLGRHPLFQAVLALQNVRQERIELPELALEPLETGSAVARFELTLTLFERGEGLAGSVEWAADLFDAATVERLLSSLKTFLAAAAGAPETGVCDLPLLSDGERQQVLVDWNDTASPLPRLSIPELFAEQARLRPAAVAVEQGDVRLTWRELHERAGRVARRLRLKPEERVAVLAERSPDLIVNLLAILQAGGAYLPLDPSHPPERRDWIMNDAGAVPLTLEETESELPRVAPDSLACVMYTSGSTGTPKGVAVTHRNVVRLVRGADYAEMEHTWLQFAPVSFDASTLEIWGPLLNGGRLVLFPGRIGSLEDLARVIERHGVTSAWLTAGLFHEMVDGRLDGLRPLRQLLAGGDVVSPAHARRVREAHPGLALINGYGPTEGTTFTCCHRITDVGETVPIGRPIANARVYVLDERLDPMPAGAWGELYAAGDGLARGYLGRPDLTAERFVPDPFGGEGERLYRTGDRVRWRADGALEFQGRLDSQLKIRGFRVEPSEVEAALLACPGVSRGAVAAIDKALAAFWVGAAQADDLRARLRERLPEPMVPSIWMPVQDLPLTPNGKVDHRALAVLASQAGHPAVERVPPGTPLEEDLAEAWAEILERDAAEIGVLDNFFDLGGHSLLATRLVSLLHARHGLDVPIHLLFDTRNLGELADRILERELGEANEELMDSLLAEIGGDE